MEELLEGASWNVTGQEGSRAAVEGSEYLAGDAQGWQATDAPGFWVKSLHRDDARGEKTLLMKVDAGAFAPLHNHDGEFEQIYVLEGSFYDQHCTLRAGDYCCRSPDALHSSGSEDGALVMLIYTKRA